MNVHASIVCVIMFANLRCMVQCAGPHSYVSRFAQTSTHTRARSDTMTCMQGSAEVHIVSHIAEGEAPEMGCDAPFNGGDPNFDNCTSASLQHAVHRHCSACTTCDHIITLPVHAWLHASSHHVCLRTHGALAQADSRLSQAVLLAMLKRMQPRLNHFKHTSLCSCLWHTVPTDRRALAIMA